MVQLMVANNKSMGFEDANTIKPLLDRHPEWQELAARMVHLYKEITETALKNEGSAD